VASCAKEEGKAKALELLGMTEDELKSAVPALAKCAFACAKEAMPELQAQLGARGHGRIEGGPGGVDAEGGVETDGSARGPGGRRGPGGFGGGRGQGGFGPGVELPDGELPDVESIRAHLEEMRAKAEEARQCAVDALGVDPREAIQECLKNEGIELPERPEGRVNAEVNSNARVSGDSAIGSIRSRFGSRIGLSGRTRRQAGGVLGEIFAQCPTAAQECQQNQKLQAILAKLQTVDKEDVRNAVCDVHAKCDPNGECKAEMEAKKAKFEAFQAAQEKCHAELAQKLKDANCDVPEHPQGKGPKDRKDRPDHPDLEAICSGEADIDLKQLFKMLQKHAGGAGSRLRGMQGGQGSPRFGGNFRGRGRVEAAAGTDA
jgi:hypothetical protein